MKKQYECHDCGNKFVLETEEEPGCPQCGSRTVTFEGYQEASFFERMVDRIKPVINFWLLPWKFFAGRSIKILNSHILMVLSVAVLLVATWQVEFLPGVDTANLFNNFPSVFRNYSSFAALLHEMGCFGKFFPAPLVVFILLLFVEFAFFEIFNFTQWLLGARADQSQTGLIFSAAIWIPNILVGTFVFIVARGAALGYWSPQLLTSSIVYMVGCIIALWCLYILVGGCFSLPEINFFSALILPLLLLAGQFIFALVVLFPVNVYLLPFMNLKPLVAGLGLWEVALQLVCFPFYLSFL